MKGAIEIRVLAGPERNLRFKFQQPVCCTVGRATDCMVRVAADGSDRTISRHHCELDIDPPLVKLRDLGSRNGTYLNGKRLKPTAGQRDGTGVARAEQLVAVPVNDGDIVTLGETSLRIALITAPDLADFPCAANAAEDAVARQECFACC